MEHIFVLYMTRIMIMIQLFISQYRCNIYFKLKSQQNTYETRRSLIKQDTTRNKKTDERQGEFMRIII